MNMDGENITEKNKKNHNLVPGSLHLPSPGVREDGKRRHPGNEVGIIIRKSDLSLYFWGERGGGVGRG